VVLVQNIPILEPRQELLLMYLLLINQGKS
jgi:hypothetical protein